MRKNVTNDVENSANPQVQKANHLAQFFQTLCMLSLTLAVCGFLLLHDPDRKFAWALGFSAAAIVSFCASFYHASKALKIYRLTKFEISGRRLETLRVTKIPEDIFKCMAELKDRIYIGEGRFFNMLADAVGTERCTEVRPKIFKYTKVG